ncbi:SUMF1/EgtB/PvdO family nonheme iron enzyme [Chloroflexota bacterium]
MAQVFISYSRKDLEFVQRLAVDIKAAGMDVWYDLSGLEVGSRWGQEIQKALRASQYFIVVLSPNSSISEWVEREFLYASNLKLKVIPILYQPCELPMWSLNLHFIDMQGKKYSRNYPELQNSLGIESDTSEAQRKLTDTDASRGRTQQPTSSKTKLRPVVLMAFLAVVLLASLGIWAIPQLKILQSPSPTFTPTPVLQIGSTWERPVDGMLMVYVPEGEFKMGSADSDLLALNNEKPQHTISLDAFWIDQTEVTNAMYSKCVSSGQCSPPISFISDTRTSYYDDVDYQDHPVIWVSWNQASEYCTWGGGRLPSEAEWEKAARGTDGNTYPWGEGIDSSLVNYGQNVGDTTEVGSYPGGASPFGALDMAGNVWEWVNDWYDSEYYRSSSAKNLMGPASGQDRVFRGGSWFDIDYLRSAFRSYSSPDSSGNRLGFRCARDMSQIYNPGSLFSTPFPTSTEVITATNIPADAITTNIPKPTSTTTTEYLLTVVNQNEFCTLQIYWSILPGQVQINALPASRTYQYIEPGQKTFTMYYYNCDPYEAGYPFREVNFPYNINGPTTWVIDSNLTPP